MVHKRYDIWQEPDALLQTLLWRVQGINGVLYFPTEDAAKRWVSAVKTYREKNGFKD